MTVRCSSALEVKGVRKEIEKRKEYGILALRETFVVREATRRSMQGNRGRDTKPELALRRALWAAGLRGYRKNVRKLPGSPDVVYGRARLAVFVHGCYWHQCPLCKRNRNPRTNAAYWEAKFAGNAERDARQQAALGEAGWRVLVIWECELKDIAVSVARVREALEIGPDVSGGRGFEDLHGVEHLVGGVGSAALEVA